MAKKANFRVLSSAYRLAARRSTMSFAGGRLARQHRPPLTLIEYVGNLICALTGGRANINMGKGTAAATSSLCGSIE